MANDFSGGSSSRHCCRLSSRGYRLASRPALSRPSDRRRTGVPGVRRNEPIRYRRRRTPLDPGARRGRVVLLGRRVRVTSRYVYFPMYSNHADETTGNGIQSMDLSWWPKISAWDGSIYDVGCWSPASEAWFQNRLANIEDNKAWPIQAGKWVKNIRKEAKFYDGFNGLGCRFLQDKYDDFADQ